ncbi:MAG: ester cyclase [Gemmatimonadota bacterium]|nr:ester cyclase [Gemmatimonadota bacterium]
MITRTVLLALAPLAFAVAPLLAQTTEEENKAVFRAMIEATNARDLDALDDLIAEDVVRHSQATPDIQVRSLEDFKAFLRGDFATVPDSEIECPMVVAEGDLVAAWCRYEGTQEGRMGPFPPSGERMELDFAGFLRFEEGKIAEMWAVWDNLTALTQTGHVPAPGGLFEGEGP